MKRAILIMDRTFEILTFINVTLMFIVVFIQVFSRLALPKAPAWTEELARFFFVGAVAFAAPLCMKYKQFVVVDIFINIMPKISRVILDIITTIFIVVFMLVVSAYSIEFVKLGSMHTAPVTGIIMAVPFSSILITSVAVFIYGILQIIDDISKGLKNGGE